MKRTQGGVSVVLIAIVMLVVAGGVIGAAFAGVINIPGLTPKKAKKAALYGEGASALYADTKGDLPKPQPEPAKPIAKSDAPVDEPEAPRHDPDKGAKKLAAVWSELPAEKVREIVADWRPEEIAPVLASMDDETSAKVIALLEPAKASKVSREIQRLASKVAPPSE